MYRATTHGIQVDVEPAYIPEKSQPMQALFFFSYRIQITNQTEENVQLLSRQWIITDGAGAVREVKGEGVIGEQPKIAPGQTYEYSSFCPLPTPTGNMRGSFMIKSANGEFYKVAVPLFFLRDMNSIQ